MSVNLKTWKTLSSKSCSAFMAVVLATGFLSGASTLGLLQRGALRSMTKSSVTKAVGVQHLKMLLRSSAVKADVILCRARHRGLQSLLLHS